MHMSDALISPSIGGTMLAVSGACVAYSIYKSKETVDENKIPLMGVMGAFVFAAQMINFTIPVTGSSGHIGGGILLAAVLGPQPAFLVLTAVLLIQALLFADGGLLALGCNIFNLGFLTCYIAYPLFFKPFMRKLSNKTLSMSSILSAIIGLQLGSFFVVLETFFSGVTKLPFKTFLFIMQPIHLAIGIVEGIITASVLIFVYKVRPEILKCADQNKPLVKGSIKKVFLTLLIITIVIGGVFSLLASSNPDGLEWSIGKVAGEEELTQEVIPHQVTQAIQEEFSILPDYSFKTDSENPIGTSVSGISGGLITLAVCILMGMVIKFLKRKKVS